MRFCVLTGRFLLFGNQQPGLLTPAQVPDTSTDHADGIIDLVQVLIPESGYLAVGFYADPVELLLKFRSDALDESKIILSEDVGLGVRYGV